MGNMESDSEQKTTLWKVKILGLQENIVLNDDEEDVRNDRTVLIIITFHILKE